MMWLLAIEKKYCVLTVTLMEMIATPPPTRRRCHSPPPPPVTDPCLVAVQPYYGSPYNDDNPVQKAYDMHC
jgi:hypothetical protein